MLVTLSGITTLVRLVQPGERRTADAGDAVGIVMLVRLVQP
jgi:hypothetical protein